MRLFIFSVAFLFSLHILAEQRGLPAKQVVEQVVVEEVVVNPRVEFWGEVVPQEVVGCSVAVHRTAMDTVLVDADNVSAFTKSGVCLWETQADLEIILLYSPPKIFVAAHGYLKDGVETLEGGVSYDWIREHKRSDQEVGVFSCRTAPGSHEWVRDHHPHLEGGLWVWGERGKTLISNLQVAARNFFRAA